ncbi:MAG: pyridoxal-phosphate dependent enzyme [Candidatus Magasanikbacteria bacterium]|nr:pyridoxal-phosphate dependent enzyme [Candidatus Magasanikbacteria bacterium]
MKTPQISHPKLANKLKISQLYLKREDQHKYDSHKGRSIPHMIKTHHEEGWDDFVISSSGNAAIAAIKYITNHNKNNDKKLYLAVFVGKKIDPKKLKTLSELALLDDGITIEQVEKPKQTAFQLDKYEKAKYLRQSTDESALFGYNSLAEELDKIENLQAIFIPTSSGTTAEALGVAFKDLKNNPQIHIVQTEYCHPIACKFDNDFIDKKEISIAGAIVDRVAHRKNEVIEVIKNSGGSGWVVNDDDIKQAQELVQKTTDIHISPNSALSIAGLKKACLQGWKFEGEVCCLITGR